MHDLFAASEPIALRQNRYFESDDVDDTRIRISAVLQPHRLEPTRGSGRVRSYMDVVRVGGITVGALDFGDEMDVIVDQMDDYYLFVFCSRGQAELSTMGRPASIGGRQGAVCVPGEPFSGRFSAGCEQFFLRIDKTTLTRHTGADLIRFDHRLDLRDPALLPWFSQLRLLATEPGMAELVRANERVAAEFERTVIGLLLAGQRHRDDAEPAAGGIAPRAVRRAEDYIARHACEPIRLADIAEAAGVPVRTLLDGFQRFRSCSPMRMVRERRLEQVRRRLREGRPDIRVADVALDCGFAHLGRFAGHYLQRYGESPSETLRRAQRA